MPPPVAPLPGRFEAKLIAEWRSLPIWEYVGLGSGLLNTVPVILSYVCFDCRRVCCTSKRLVAAWYFADDDFGVKPSGRLKRDGWDGAWNMDRTWPKPAVP